MIDKNKIVTIAEDFLTKEQFLVDIEISSKNRIHVIIDSMQGVNIESCIKLSKTIEEQLDRNEEDYELQVSSAGLGLPFKVYRQYIKNINKEVEVITTDGQKLSGIIKNATDLNFELEVTKKVKLEGMKKKELVTEVIKFTFDQIKTVKNIIKF